MKWIESGGGPFILVPTDHLPEWRGIDAGPSEDETDYDRACEISDDIGILEVGGTHAVVFGDEPFRTTWVPNEKGGGFVVRWVYADNENSVTNYIAQGGLERVVTDAGVSVRLNGPCVLFDAAEPGDDIRAESIAIGFSPGRYVVKSALVDVSPEVRLLIHQLAPDS